MFRCKDRKMCTLFIVLWYHRSLQNCSFACLLSKKCYNRVVIKKCIWRKRRALFLENKSSFVSFCILLYCVCRLQNASMLGLLMTLKQFVAGHTSLSHYGGVSKFSVMIRAESSQFLKEVTYVPWTLLLNKIKHIYFLSFILSMWLLNAHLHPVAGE